MYRRASKASLLIGELPSSSPRILLSRRLETPVSTHAVLYQPLVGLIAKSRVSWVPRTVPVVTVPSWIGKVFCSEVTSAVRTSS